MIPFKTRTGPHTWAKKYAIAGGKRQSPINIKTSSVTLDEDLNKKPLKVTFPSKVIDITNTGYGWKAHVHAEDSKLEGGPLENTYQLVQFHCHWGPDRSTGSEHQVDGRSYAGEVLIIYRNLRMNLNFVVEFLADPFRPHEHQIRDR